MATVEIVQIKTEPEDDDQEADKKDIKDPVTNILNEPYEGPMMDISKKKKSNNTEKPMVQIADEAMGNINEETIANTAEESLADIAEEPMDNFTEKSIEGEFISPLELLRQHMTDPAIASINKNIKKVKRSIKVKALKGVKSIKKEGKAQCEQCNKVFTSRALLLAHSKIHAEGFPYECDRCQQRFKLHEYLKAHIRRVHKGIRKHSCDVCGMKFQSNSGLKAHKRLHTGEKPFKCEDCGKAFTKKSTLTIHRLIHTGERNYKCHICDKTFNRDFVLNNHMLIHTNEKPYKCSFCEYACRDSSTLRKHEHIHMGARKIYNCKLCSASFKTKYRLKQHVAERHLNLDVRVHECEHCLTRFMSSQGLRKHIDTLHRKLYEFQCQVCHKVFSSKHNMKSHLSRHYDERPYACGFEGCGKRFKAKGDLGRHAVIHDTSRHHPCPTCDRKFVRKWRLAKHMKMHKARWKDTACPLCHSTFYNETYLATHIKFKHNRTEVYECDYCGSISKNKPGLVMHIRQMHIKTKKLKCKECGKMFKNITPLKLHYWSVHRIRHKERTRIFKKKVEIKQEIIEVEDRDLEKDIENEQMQEGYTKDEKVLNESLFTDGEMSADIAKSLISVHSRQLRRVPEAVFDRLYLQNPPVKKAYTQVPKDQSPPVSYQELSKSLPEARVYVQDIFTSRLRAKVTNYRKQNNGDLNGLMEFKTQLKNEEKLRKNPKVGLEQIVIENVQEKYGKYYQVKISLVQCPLCKKLFENDAKLAEHAIVHNKTDSATQNNEQTPQETADPQKTKKKRKPKINLPASKHNIRIKTKQLNREARTKQKNEVKNKVVLKSRLVRKGKNWIVENLPEKVNEEEIQKIINNNTVTNKTDSKEDLTTDPYLENLKVLGIQAKKEGREMLFPCDKCPKVCTAFCGIKLHRRVHNTQAKPFKPKIWKHKLKISEQQKPKVVKKINDAKPGPIRNKHKCDDELKEFYKNCIRGSNIEFWQFLKIFNKIDRENVKEFSVIEEGREFNEENYIAPNVREKPAIKPKYRVLKHLSKKEQLERRIKIKQLRTKLNKHS